MLNVAIDLSGWIFGYFMVEVMSDDRWDDALAGGEAARRIWDDEGTAGTIEDPRTTEFAHAMIDTAVEILHTSKGLIKRMISQAAAGAEDLAVAQFQGIIEVIQNADDVRATEVRFALRLENNRQQLLIVHNGLPVTCHNVLGMALPYLTSKTERVDQRGRFGIGMKTLKRIADAVSIHSAPYHFSGDQLRFQRIEPEPALPGFYEPGSDTLLVVDLNANFSEEELRAWFDAWEPDSLLFLASVSRFRWCTTDGTTIAERALEFSAWENTDYSQDKSAILKLAKRRVTGPSDAWTVWRATLQVPENLHPAHKARSDVSDISIALADGDATTGLFIGFRSQIPLLIPFSIDAQFDPNTSREDFIENAWNNWLIDSTAEVVATIAQRLLLERPQQAWSLVPLEDELIGKNEGRWPATRFAAAFERARIWIGNEGMVRLPSGPTPVGSLIYEDEGLTGLLEETDLERMLADHKAVVPGIRDREGRWRNVLNSIGASSVIGTTELLEALATGTFDQKEPDWWVRASACLVEIHPDHELFGTPFLLADDGRAIGCSADGRSERPIVFEAAPSAFAMRWRLLDRLHPTYAQEAGKPVIAWLTAEAAFTSHLEPEIELGAFVEHFSGRLFEITDEELRELRDVFDDVSSDRRAQALGSQVGAFLALDGHCYKAGKLVRQKVPLSQAYLTKTLDGENSTWPDAAGTTPGLFWIAARYEDVLKTGTGRWRRRKREDGTVSRGGRRFLTLLGAEVAPRISSTEGRVIMGGGARYRELRALGANQVRHDLVSTDLAAVLKSIQKTSKKDAKNRSPALLRTLSRNWDRLYAASVNVPAEHMAIKHARHRGEVTANWLNLLRETDWVAVGRGERVVPSAAVLKTPETQALYEKFVCGIDTDDLIPDCAARLQLIRDVRIGDLLGRLEELRDHDEDVSEAQIVQIYRTIAKRCPARPVYNARIGELTVQDVRERFLAGSGLIHVTGAGWKRPDEVMRGMDIFHDRRHFVPTDPACTRLWIMMEVREPDLDDCIRFCRELTQESYGTEVEAALMDVYRYMEGRTDGAERRHRDRLRQLPLYCNGGWVSGRPVFWIENAELRAELVARVQSLHCWAPPCDVRALPKLMQHLAVQSMDMSFRVEGETHLAAERGEAMRLRFGHAVDHLSAELAKSEPGIRERIRVDWDTLKLMPLLVPEGRVPMRVRSPDLPPSGVEVRLRAFVDAEPYAIHFSEDDMGDRDYGGQAIASFFPPDVRRRIDAEWALAWQKSRDSAAEAVRLASDERRKEAMQETAEAINASPRGKISVSPPKSRTAPIEPRTLKQAVGSVVGATVQPGSPKPDPGPVPKPKKKLHSSAPNPGGSGGRGPISAPAAYTNADLEQRGWEVLTQALETSPDKRLTDFRTRHGVGADGAFDWKRFVEMKATARSPQSQIELSNNEYERAKERGSDYILALVSGLETGQKDEVRLIFDPANCATVRPSNGMRLVGLLDAPAVVIHFQSVEESENGQPDPAD